MPLSPRLKGVLLVLGIIIVLPTALFFTIEPFMSWYGWSEVERNRVASTVPIPAATSTVGSIPAVSVPQQSDAAVYKYSADDARESIADLRQEVDLLTALQLAPRDAKSRPLLTRELVGFLVRKGWDLRAASSIATGWNTDVDYRQVEAVKIDKPEYVLTVPYSASWGNARFGVVPYEQFEEGRVLVIFGPITNLENEMTGVQRTADFALADKRTEVEALADEESLVGEEWCGSPGRRALPTDIVRIGAFRALRLEDRGCEGGSISYEVFGKNSNYLFVARGLQPNDTLLRWTIERFREK